MLIPTVALAQLQPGSTGGTIGKTVKAVSGGEEEEPSRSGPKIERPARQPSSASIERGSASKCGNLDGDWHYAHGPNVRYTSAGTAIDLSDGALGVWTCNGSEIIVTWTAGPPAGHVHRMNLSADGQRFTGTGPVGYPLSATRK
jgi:hypothetical protein